MASLDDPAQLQGQGEGRGERMGARRTAGAVREAVPQELGAGRARTGQQWRARASVSRSRGQARTGVDLLACYVSREGSDRAINTP